MLCLIIKSTCEFALYFEQLGYLEVCSLHERKRRRGIDQFGFKNVISLCPPCFGASKEHDKRFQTTNLLIAVNQLSNPPLWNRPQVYSKHNIP